MSAQDRPDLSRRMFRPAASASAPSLRPPWTDDVALAAACTRCGACLTACAERIIVADAQGLPSVDFRHGACTFCGACADACTADVFDRTREPPWYISAHVNPSCLAARRVVCQSCRDACPVGAIKFLALRGGVSLPGVIASRCTGCGACVSVCPTEAIELRKPGS